MAYRLYYVKTALAKHWVALHVHGPAGQFVVEADGHEVQRHAIKGLGVGRLPFPQFVEHLCAEARMLRSAPAFGRPAGRFGAGT